MDNSDNSIAGAPPAADSLAAIMPAETDDVTMPVLDGIVDLLDAGGPVVAILLVMSIVALAIAFAKVWQFRQARLGTTEPARLALDACRDGDTDAALAILHGARNPVCRVLVCAIRGQRRGIPEGRIREEVMRLGGDLLEELRAWLRPLEVIASLAPLLGLFGTVLGMIAAFQRLAEAGNRVDPSILSGGIWEALLTTAVGLAVAIPTVALLSWFERRVERVAHDLDSLVTRIFTDDLSEQTDVRTSPRCHGGARLRPAAVAAHE